MYQFILSKCHIILKYEIFCLCFFKHYQTHTKLSCLVIDTDINNGKIIKLRMFVDYSKEQSPQ